MKDKYMNTSGKLLLFLRALSAKNFYNWNKPVKNGEYSFILSEMYVITDVNVGDTFVVTSVNRTTGRVTFKRSY